MPLTKEQARELGKSTSRKGIPNKTTEEIRQSFKYLIENNINNLEEWLNQIAENNPEKAMHILIKLSEFVLPKLNRTEISASLSVEQFLAMPQEQRQAKIIELQTKLNKQ
ncbi:hypothetical protein [Croceibacter atlanticus]|uniref:hypothetical protein n=1 Tax=Croceibacter atlanticus TaxID=313588 RepID=UPI0030DAEE7A|tara:strand:+ start:158390 stop:158719 length:330 start_codon:yes stop_codon:yes gene_type:complete